MEKQIESTEPKLNEYCVTIKVWVWAEDAARAEKIVDRRVSEELRHTTFTIDTVEEA